MQRVERRFDGVHGLQIFLRRLAQEVGAFGYADAVLAGCDAAKPVGLGIGLVHIGVQLTLPGLVVALAAHDAEPYLGYPLHG